MGSQIKLVISFRGFILVVYKLRVLKQFSFKKSYKANGRFFIKGF